MAFRPGLILWLLGVLVVWTGAPVAFAAGDGSPEMTALFERILADPTDVDANLAYARLAERMGERRKALATYERILINDPGNAEARQGLARVRRAIEPAWTNLTVSTGIGYNSNPLQRPDTADRPGSVFGLIDARFRDERPLGWWRWRTELFGGGRLYEKTHQMSNGYVGGEIGPLLPVAGRAAVRPIVIAGYRWLDGTDLYGEIGGGVEVEGRFQGALQALRLAAVWRDYGEDWSSDSGPVIDLAGRFSRPALLFDNDALFIRPRVRWSDVGSNPVSYLPTQFEVGKYWEIGGRIDYRIAWTDVVTTGIGAALYQRWFADPVMSGADDRSDTYFAPGVNVTFSNLLTDSVDLRLDYIYQMQTSNDPSREFDAHLVTGRVVGRF
ncbi:tetratricopeptide repeat protein [Amorphus sp. 3PC139-8]|uniref:tetratricopeptide repeat protein n=1 Tax=Amorphus sp. 3PC139-8 TaxID=2735676 RepID=UPI00345E039B